MLTQALGPLFSTSRNPTPPCLQPDSPLASRKCWSQGDCGVKQHQKILSLPPLVPQWENSAAKITIDTGPFRLWYESWRVRERYFGDNQDILGFYLFVVCYFDRKYTHCNHGFLQVKGFQSVLSVVLELCETLTMTFCKDCKLVDTDKHFQMLVWTHFIYFHRLRYEKCMFKCNSHHLRCFKEGKTNTIAQYI